MNFEDRIFKNFKSRAKQAFKHHKCEHLIPKSDHDQEYEKILGCDRFQFAKFLKSKFKDGMSESNYGIDGWHIDHIFPLARATKDNLIFWLHYLNTQPLWKKHNQDKCDFIFDLNEICLVEKNICESKQMVYIDTIDPIQVCKFSRPYLKELKYKGQITDDQIDKIKNLHRDSLKTKNKKLLKSEKQKIQEEKRQKRIDVYNKKENNQKNDFAKLQLMYNELNQKYLNLQKENEELKNKLYKTKQSKLQLQKIENTNPEDIKMFEELFKK
jgi:hypothetical protein